jgi:hypothetical protein
MLTIKKDFGFDEFEIAIRRARKEPQMRLPSQIKHIGFWGLEVALIQLIVTWARSHQNPVIKSYINDGDTNARSDQLEDLGKRLYGIAALYLAGRMTTGQNTDIPKTEYASHCAEVLRLMNACDIYSPESVNRTYPKNKGKVAAQFICLHGSGFEFQGALYNGRSRAEAIGRTQFKAIVKSAILEDKAFTRFLDDKPEALGSLANLLYELFQNTNDHAYETLNGKSFAKNIRAISLKGHSDVFERKDLGDMKSHNKKFNEYLAHCMEMFRNKGLGTHRFLELSIVDGGVGIAQRFTGAELSTLSLEEEKEITVKCFRDGVSSKGSDSRGEGLDEVWKALCELDGFIRVRTGRLCLFQTFHNRKVSDKRAFSSWSSVPLAHAEGTAVTIIIPCAY